MRGAPTVQAVFQSARSTVTTENASSPMFVNANRDTEDRPVQNVSNTVHIKKRNLVHFIGKGT